ncbi:MAG: hypothetical protein RIS43_740 [Actinomycetota bacterium]
MIRLRRFLATKAWRDQAGNAVVGFAIGAPIVALLASLAIGLTGDVWSRNVAIEIVRAELHQYAIHGSTQVATETELTRRFSDQGLRIEKIEWPAPKSPYCVELRIEYRKVQSDAAQTLTIAEVAFLE